MKQYEHVFLALSKYGLTGIDGPQSNPEIVQMFHDLGYTEINDDETPWCACFLNWVLVMSNMENSGALNARSFLKVGTEVIEPMTGDIVVLWRISPTGPYGHCGIFIRETNNLIYILGGNEDNSVKIKPYPKSQLLGYRQVHKKD